MYIDREDKTSSKIHITTSRLEITGGSLRGITEIVTSVVAVNTVSESE